MSEITSVSAYLKAQENAGQLRAKAIDELLANRAEIDRQLGLLDYDGDGKPPTKKNGAKPLHCPVCNVGGHDRRKHRDHPAAFTKEELVAFS